MTPTLFTLGFIDGLGGGEMMLIFFVILILFGGKRLPELARGLGKSVREFKKATAGMEDEIKRVLEEPAASATKPATPAKPLHTPAIIEPLTTSGSGETPTTPAGIPPAANPDARGTPPAAEKSPT